MTLGHGSILIDRCAPWRDGSGNDSIGATGSARCATFRIVHDVCRAACEPACPQQFWAALRTPGEFTAGDERSGAAGVVRHSNHPLAATSRW